MHGYNFSIRISLANKYNRGFKIYWTTSYSFLNPLKLYPHYSYRSINIKSKSVMTLLSYIINFHEIVEEEKP